MSSAGGITTNSDPSVCAARVRILAENAISLDTTRLRSASLRLYAIRPDPHQISDLGISSGQFCEVHNKSYSLLTERQ